MGMNRIGIFAAAALAAVALAGAPAAAKKGSDDGAKSTSLLAATGVVPGAEGQCRIKFGGSKSRFEVRVANLAANAEHVLEVNGLPWAAFTTDKKGRARLRFSSRPKGSKELALPGDPRGGALSVDDGADDVLAGVCSGEGESSGSTAKLRARLAPTGLAPAGSEAKASFEIRKDGRRKFEVEIEGVPSGDYPVFVDGTQRGSIAVGSLGRGQLEWGDDNGGPPLDFDPRGKLIDVAGTDGILFSGSLDGAIPGVNQCTFSETVTPLVPAPAAGAGSGDTKLRIRDDCRRDFSVEIEDVPVGAYDLLVGGVSRGTLQVTDVGGQNKGELEFTSEPGEVDELFLDFEPVGATVEVKQGATLFFSLTQGPPGTGGGGGGGSCDGAPLEINLPLIATGGSGAQGDVRYRLRDDCSSDFKVEIEDVADGSYDLQVGGVSRGTISVVAGKGEVEFSDPVEPGKTLLEFDPRGMLVEVLSGATVILERSIPQQRLGQGHGPGRGAATPRPSRVRPRPGAGDGRCGCRGRRACTRSARSGCRRDRGSRPRTRCPWPGPARGARAGTRCPGPRARGRPPAGSACAAR